MRRNKGEEKQLKNLGVLIQHFAHRSRKKNGSSRMTRRGLSLWHWMFCHHFWMIIGSKINTPHRPHRKSPAVSLSRVITRQALHISSRGHKCPELPHTPQLFVHSAVQRIQVRILPRSQKALGAFGALWILSFALLSDLRPAVKLCSKGQKTAKMQWLRLSPLCKFSEVRALLNRMLSLSKQF